MFVCACVCLFPHAICPQVQLSLGDFTAARRSLKKAVQLGSQQPLDRQAVKKVFKYGERARYGSFSPADYLYLLKAFFVSLFIVCFSNIWFLCWFFFLTSQYIAELMAWLDFSHNNNFKADKGCKLEEEIGDDLCKKHTHEAVGLAEQLGDLYCKVACYSKALDAYQAQVRETLTGLWPHDLELLVSSIHCISLHCSVIFSSDMSCVVVV